MELRAALVPNEPDPERRAELKRRILEIEKVLERGEDASALIEAFNHDTGRSHDARFFLEYWRSRDLEDVVDEACQPRPGRVPDITRAELVEIVRRAMPTQPRFEPRYESFYRELFEANVPRPHAASLIHNPPDPRRHGIVDWAPSPEEVVELALAYRPIQL
ncbi:hypothetical protein [Archangium lipolyticum]|uniref:hypothetical protein n=1 Tax=Archangium lipolyticum TaxID=2970465 RepID=UPI00214A1F0E|nr:hypothetical protein [Archangium lipolyticum]